MSEHIGTAAPAPITLDDVRHKALKVREDIVTEAKSQVAEKRNEMILVGIIAVVAVFSLVYFAGTRAGRSSCTSPTR